MNLQPKYKDIAGYTPYGIIAGGNNEYFGYIIGFLSIHSTDFKNGTMEYSIVNERDYTMESDRLRDFDLFLRPMSDISKKITHRGLTFTPLIEIAKMVYPNIKEWTFNDRGWLSGNKNGYPCYITPRHLELCSYEIFDKLHEWMFDIRGLIPQGLAKDINTLPKNPYL